MWSRSRKEHGHFVKHKSLTRPFRLQKGALSPAIRPLNGRKSLQINAHCGPTPERPGNFIRVFPGLAIFERSEALLFLGVLVGFAALTRKTWLKGCRERLKRHWALPVAVLAFSVPALIASVLIFPEPWYLKACLLLWVASIAWLIGYRPPDERVDGTVVALAVVLVIVTVPSVWAHYAGSDGRVKLVRTVRTTAAIRSLCINH